MTTMKYGGRGRRGAKGMQAEGKVDGGRGRRKEKGLGHASFVLACPKPPFVFFIIKNSCERNICCARNYS